ncbi:MAG TPA: enoyl-CoA hydratase-related protein [Gemmatimonadales bacterium]|nr:enoyl-CoA hydratase-related protein [Gemmatimonadales bacterium]
MTYSTLLLEIADGIAVITINRPDKLNALNDTVITELGAAADQVLANAAVRGIIVTGSGAKAFVAGADISELATTTTSSAQLLSAKGSRVFRRLEQSPKPVIAAVNGFALGGGCELAMACHLRLASENARFGQPEVKLGITPGYGGTVRLARLVGRGRAIELLISAGMIDAQEAWRIGLVNRVVGADQLIPECRKLLGVILENGPLAVAGCLGLVDAQEGRSLDDALALESGRFGELAGTGDFREGTGAFLEKRKAVFRGV